jgi:plasmid replication initiation protein
VTVRKPDGRFYHLAWRFDVIHTADATVHSLLLEEV